MNRRWKSAAAALVSGVVLAASVGHLPLANAVTASVDNVADPSAVSISAPAVAAGSADAARNANESESEPDGAFSERAESELGSTIESDGSEAAGPTDGTQTSPEPEATEPPSSSTTDGEAETSAPENSLEPSDGQTTDETESNLGSSEEYSEGTPNKELTLEEETTDAENSKASSNFRGEPSGASLVIEKPMAGYPSPHAIDGNAICVTQMAQGTNESDFSPIPAQVQIKVPADSYLVVDVVFPSTWDLWHYFTYDYKYFRAEVEIKIGSSFTTTPIVANYSSPPDQNWIHNIDNFTARIIVAANGAPVPGAFTTADGSVISTSGIPVMNVDPDQFSTMGLGVGMIAVNDFGMSGGILAPTTLALNWQVYEGATAVAGEAGTQSSTVPEFVRLDENPDWTGYKSCAAIPLGDATYPTLTKAFSPALIPYGGTSTLTFTLERTNTSTIDNTELWEFDDSLPSVQLGGDSETLQMIALTSGLEPLDASTDCLDAGINSLNNPGEAVADIHVYGKIPAGEDFCTLSLEVTTQASDAAAARPALFTIGDPNFAFPVDFTNTVDTSTGNKIVAGTASANLRVDVPTVKVDLSAPLLQTNNDDSVQASWLVSVINASNLRMQGSVDKWDFCDISSVCPEKNITVEGAYVSANLGSYLTDLRWSAPDSSGRTDQPGLWLLPDLAPGQMVQAILTAQFNPGDFFLPVCVGSQAIGCHEIGDKLALLGSTATNGTLQADVTLTVPTIPTKPAAKSSNELANDTVTGTWQQFVGAMDPAPDPAWPQILDASRVASTLIDTDRWDQSKTQLTPAALDVALATEQTLVVAAGPVPYTLTVTNVGATMLTNVTLDDVNHHRRAATGTSIIDCEVPQDAIPGSVTLADDPHIPSLAPGQSATCQGRYTINPGDIEDGDNVVAHTDAASEGIWADPDGMYLHVRVEAWGTPEYLNPSWVQSAIGNSTYGPLVFVEIDGDAGDSSSYPDPTLWLYPDKHITNPAGSGGRGSSADENPFVPEYPLTVSNTASLRVAVFGGVELPAAGLPERRPYQYLGYFILVFAAPVAYQIRRHRHPLGVRP